MPVLEPAGRLESWKEIAAYLKRDVRTVQRWEAFEDLPVHRHQHKKRGSVYAYPAELDAWRDSRHAELFNSDEAGRDVATPRKGWRYSWPWIASATVVAAAIVTAVVWTRELRRAPVVTVSNIDVDAPRLFGEALQDGGTLDRIPIGGEGSDLSVAPDGATLFVSLCEPGNSGVQAIDVATRTIKWSVGSLNGCTPLIISARGDRLFMQDRTDVVIIDTATQAIRRIGTPAASLRDLALMPDGRTLYAAAAFRGLLSIDTTTGAVQTLSRLPCPVHLALTPSGDRLYVNYQCAGPGGSRGHDTIEVIDTQSDKSVALIKDLPNVGGAIVVTPDGSQVWANGSDACLSAYYDQLGCPPGRGAILNVIRTSDHTLLRSLRVGPVEDFSVRLSLTNDGSRVVVGRTHTTVMSTASLREIESSPLRIWGNVAFSPDGRTAYAILGERRSVAILPIAEHAAPPPGLTARWMLDGTGTDSAGENDLGPFGAEAFAPGRLGMSLRFGGTPAIRLHSPPNLGIDAGVLTAMAWVKFGGSGDEPMTVMEYVTSGPGGLFGWTLRKGPDGRASVCVGWFNEGRCGLAKSAIATGATSLAPGHWYHIAITRSEDSLTLYVDGRVDGTGRVKEGVPLLTDMWMRLGSDEAGSSPLEGLLDEIEIYSRALTPQEITSRGK